MPLGRRARSAPLDLLAPSALRDRKAIWGTKATVDCKVLKATALSAPKVSLDLADWMEPLGLLAPKGRKAIAEVTDQLARRGKWGLAVFKACAETPAHKELKALVGCKALRESADRKAPKELWDYAVTLAHKGHRAKFPRVL